jgi:hypothetical protein
MLKAEYTPAQRHSPAGRIGSTEQKSTTSCATEPATFPLVAECLNQPSDSVIEVFSLYGTEQNSCLAFLTWWRDQIQFAKYCVFLYLEFWTMKEVQKPNNFYLIYCLRYLNVIQ